MALSGPDKIAALGAKFTVEQRDAYTPMANVFILAKRGDKVAQRQFMQFKKDLTAEGKFSEFEDYFKNCYMPIQRIMAESKARIDSVDEKITAIDGQIDAITHKIDLEKRQAQEQYRKEMGSVVTHAGAGKKKY
tara:strand:+ start:7936 stop:8337 length:402 start_codon:yes stop_codon:yes gene_type:complete